MGYTSLSMQNKSFIIPIFIIRAIFTISFYILRIIIIHTQMSNDYIIKSNRRRWIMCNIVNTHNTQHNQTQQPHLKSIWLRFNVGLFNVVTILYHNNLWIFIYHLSSNWFSLIDVIISIKKWASINWLEVKCFYFCVSILLGFVWPRITRLLL